MHGCRGRWGGGIAVEGMGDDRRMVKIRPLRKGVKTQRKNCQMRYFVESRKGVMGLFECVLV